MEILTLTSWENFFEQADLETEVIRNKKLIRESALQALEISVFFILSTDKRFLKLKKQLAGE